MQLSTQQIEALRFFDRVPLEWRARAEGEFSRVNVVRQRNACVHRVCAANPAIRQVLDIGCGTGELVFELAARGVDATGIDFAEGMIRTCEERQAELGEMRARFRCCSAWDFGAAPESYDLISALGVIEYVAPNELSELLALCQFALRPGGMLVISSRNRLFNLVSLNEYTRMELTLGTVERLARESLALCSSADLESALAAAPGRDLPPHPEQPPSWIGVGVRHQYTPATLAGFLRLAGFDIAAAYPVHYHALPPAVAAVERTAYIDFANRMYADAPGEHRLIPFCSSFVLAARKV